MADERRVHLETRHRPRRRARRARGRDSVWPPREDGSKAPLGAWGRAQTRRADRRQVEKWYGPKTGLGFVTGAVSGNLECLEFDDVETYRRFLEAAGSVGIGDLVERIEAGYEEASPSGGIHWLYRCETIAGNTKLASRPGSKPGTVSTLIETRGEGGFLIAAPSHGKVHPSGRPYELLRGGAASIVEITADERELLFELARSFDEMPSAAPVEAPPARNGELPPGADFNRRADWSEILAGWERVFERDGVVYWRRPGKAQGVSATTGRCRSEDGAPRLKVFSTSTPFDASRTYDAFGAYATFHHGGDLRATARDLAGQGFGSPARNGKPRTEPSGEDGWPPLRLGELPPPEPFPLDVLPEPARDLASAAAVSIGCPADFPAFGCLAAASAAIGRSAILKVKDGYYVNASLYAATVGRSSAGKTPALAAALRPLDRIAAEQYRRHAEALAAWEAADHESRGERPTATRLTTSDPTVEALGPILAKNPRGLIVRPDELTSFVMSMNQYKGGKGGDRPHYLKVWSGAPLEIDRAKHMDGPIFVAHPFLTIVGGITPDMLSELSEKKDRNDGFLPRFLFAWPERRRSYSDAGLADSIEAEWERVVRRLWNRPMRRDPETGRLEPAIVGFTADAQDLYGDYARHLILQTDDGELPAFLDDAYGKLENYLARLALVLNLLDLADADEGDALLDVPLATVERAIQLVEYFKSHIERVHAALSGGAAGMPDGARIVLKWIKKTGHRRFGETTLKDYRKRFREDEATMADGLQWLADRNAIRRVEPEDRPGPKPAIWEVNPRVHMPIGASGSSGSSDSPS